jgi:hypothetical protein
MTELYKPDDVSGNKMSSHTKRKCQSPVKKKNNDQKSKKKRKHQEENDNQESKKQKLQRDNHDNLFDSSDEETDQEENNLTANSDSDYDNPSSGTKSDISVDAAQYKRIMKLIKNVSKKCKHDGELFDKVQNFMEDIALLRIGYDDNWDGTKNDSRHGTPIRLIGYGPLEQHKKLEPCTDNQAVPLLLKELNAKYHDCLSLRENTERTIQIDMEHFCKKQMNTNEFKALLRAITVHPDLGIILTNLPDVGDEMLKELVNSRFAQQPNAHIRLFSQGRFRGTTTKQLSLKYVLDTQSLSNETQDITYEVTKNDGTTAVLDVQATELSMYYTDISANRANPGMMEMYKSTMPKVIKDLLPYEMNDFCKYVSFSPFSTK